MNTQPDHKSLGQNAPKSRFTDPDDLFLCLASKLEEHVAEVNLTGAEVLLVGFHGDDSGKIQKMLRAAGAYRAMTFEAADRLKPDPEAPRNFTHIIVNVDMFNVLERAVGALLNFRRRHKDVVVVLVSSSVTADDLSAQRKPICDATLSVPVTFNRLVNGLVQGTINNRELVPA